MVRDLYKETKAEVFWPFEKTWGLAKEHLGRKDRWDKRKRKTKKAMGKGHTGCFRHVIKVGRYWHLIESVSAVKSEMRRPIALRPAPPSLLIKPYTRLIHNKPQINNVQNQLTRRAWFPSWAGRSGYSISAISTWKSELIVITLIFSGNSKKQCGSYLVFDLTALICWEIFFFWEAFIKTSQLRLKQTFTFLPWITYFLKKRW